MKNDKKALLDFAEKNGWKYPKVAVLFKFAIIGSAIGGFIFGIVGIMISFGMAIIDHDLDNFFQPASIISMLSMPFFMVALGVLCGSTPAFMTGLILTSSKFILTDKKDYLTLLCLGGFVSMMTYLAVIIFLNSLHSLHSSDWLAGFGFFLLGGISAMICGKLFLPKLDLEQAKPL